jgi:hypothetical protein
LRWHEVRAKNHVWVPALPGFVLELMKRAQMFFWRYLFCVSIAKRLVAGLLFVEFPVTEKMRHMTAETILQPGPTAHNEVNVSEFQYLAHRDLTFSAAVLIARSSSARVGVGGFLGIPIFASLRKP